MNSMLVNITKDGSTFDITFDRTLNITRISLTSLDRGRTYNYTASYWQHTNQVTVPECNYGGMWRLTIVTPGGTYEGNFEAYWLQTFHLGLSGGFAPLPEDF